MENTVPAFVEPATESEYQAAMKQLFEDFRRLNRAIRADQEDLDRMGSDSRRLYEETQEIKARTQANLDTLESMVLQ